MRIEEQPENVITKGQIKKLQSLIKTGGVYDASDIRNIVINLENACSVVHGSVFEILDLALEHLAIKAQNATIILPKDPTFETPEQKRRRNMNKPIEWWLDKDAVPDGQAVHEFNKMVENLKA